jgi:hypothetical protein
MTKLKWLVVILTKVDDLTLECLFLGGVLVSASLRLPHSAE